MPYQDNPLAVAAIDDGVSLVRRGFVAAAGAAALSSFAVPALGASRKSDMPRKWDINTNVLVVGAGGAGLAAAVAAAEAGAAVMVIDSADRVGGTTAISDGCFAAADGENPEGDSVELHIRQTLEAGGFCTNPELVRVLCERAPEAIAWIRSFGLRMSGWSQPVGGAFPRCVTPNNRGLGFVLALKARADALGVQFRLGTSCQQIIREGNRAGWVLGVAAENPLGRRILIHATRGVVLAAGGFACSAVLRQIHLPGLKDLASAGVESAQTGLVLRQARAIGAHLAGMENVDCSVAAVRRDRTFIRPALHMDVARSIFVDGQGRRFVREDASFPELAKAVMALPDRHFFVLVDRLGFGALDAGTKVNTQVGELTGDVMTARSLEGIARSLGLAPDRLKETVSSYNLSVAGHHDTLGKSARNLRFRLENGPFWAARCALGIQTTLGGIAIDARGHALNDAGNPLPGLFAAGDIAGGIHGRNSLGGNTLAAAIVFGREAGNAAARSL